MQTLNEWHVAILGQVSRKIQISPILSCSCSVEGGCRLSHAEIMAAIFKPTADQMASIIDLNGLMDCVGMTAEAPTASEPSTGTESPAEAASRPALLSQKRSFIAMLELESNMHYRLLASVGTDPYLAALTAWRHNGEPPSVGLRAKATLAHHTARCLCGMES